MAKKHNPIELLWKDRKRFWGMPLSFTRYAMSDDRLFLSKGFLNIRDEELLLYRVRDIDTSRNLWQRICGVGTVTVYSSDKSTPVLVMKNIKNPVNVKEMLHHQVEDMKIRRRVRMDEISVDGGHCCHDEHNEHGTQEDDLDDDMD